MSLTDYEQLIEDSIDSPELLKKGYRVELQRNETNIVVKMFHGPEVIGSRATSFTRPSDYAGSSSRVPRSFTEILSDIEYNIRAIHDDYNKTLENPELLKALEDRLNGAPAEMLVLGEPVPHVEDKRPIHLTTVSRGFGYWRWECADCEESEDWNTQKDAAEDAMRHTLGVTLR